MQEQVTATKRPRRIKRRGNGEGCIHQRSNGRWEATVSVGYNAEGKRRRHTVYGSTKAEVLEKLTSLQSRKLGGTLGEATNLNMVDFLNQWLETYARPTIRETT